MMKNYGQAIWESETLQRSGKLFIAQWTHNSHAIESGARRVSDSAGNRRRKAGGRILFFYEAMLRKRDLRFF